MVIIGSCSGNSVVVKLVVVVVSIEVNRVYKDSKWIFWMWVSMVVFSSVMCAIIVAKRGIGKGIVSSFSGILEV